MDYYWNLQCTFVQLDEEPNATLTIRQKRNNDAGEEVARFWFARHITDVDQAEVIALVEQLLEQCFYRTMGVQAALQF
jgi:hypothetical protein